MIRALSAIAAAFALAAMHAFATPQPIDATGLWIKADESGWGVSVYHQGDTLFASLFVYGPDGQPKWYTASSLSPGPTTYTGALVEATGPYFGAPSFDANAVVRRTVGTMTMTLDATGANLAYSVDGTQVSKRIQRFSLRPIPLAGGIGALVQPAQGTTAEIRILDQHIGWAGSGSSLEMWTDSNRTGGCDYWVTALGQDGDAVRATGNGHCTGDPLPPQIPWSTTLDITPHGFTGTFSGNMGDKSGLDHARYAAASRSAPVMQGNGWADDLWFPPGEGGWGLNLIEQGDTGFATLFVFDAQNRPHWYSASQLIAGAPNGVPTWIGNLEETAGPYFGSAFDPARVTRRVVGTMSFSIVGNDPNDGRLTYTADGVTVTKRVNRFAFRKNDLSGTYQGSVVMRSDDPRGGSYDDAEFTIDDQGDRFTMSIVIYTGPTCTFTGQSTQYGAQRSVSGTYACGSAQGNFRLDDLMVTANGLTGTYAGPAGHISGLITKGHIAGVRR